MINMNTILTNLVLVGEPTNPFVVSALQVSINPMDLNLIPQKYIPRLNFNYFTFDPMFNDEIF